VSMYLERAVTQADDVSSNGTTNRPTVHTHRIGIIEEIRLGAELEYVSGDLDQGWHHARGARNTAHHHAIANRLKDAIFSRNSYIRCPCTTSAHADRRDNHIGICQQIAPVGGGSNRYIGLSNINQTLTELGGHLQGLCVNVHKSQRPRLPCFD